MHITKTLWARSVKRGFDAVSALALLIISFPFLVAIAGLVKLTSRGPVLFAQLRSGRFGEPFTALKFRSMRGGRVPDATELVPLDHPDITAVGRVLRRYKIDELPQLYNVVRGDMALIGPRPTLAEQVGGYDDFQKRRLEIRPGITGLAQVQGNTALTWEERIEWDIWYVDHISLGLDLWILGRTVMTVVAGEDRYLSRFNPEWWRRSE